MKESDGVEMYIGIIDLEICLWRETVTGWVVREIASGQSRENKIKLVAYCTALANCWILQTTQQRILLFNTWQSMAVLH